jgi:hypothetical protein
MTEEPKVGPSGRLLEERTKGHNDNVGRRALEGTAHFHRHGFAAPEGIGRTLPQDDLNV